MQNEHERLFRHSRHQRAFSTVERRERQCRRACWDCPGDRWPVLESVVVCVWKPCEWSRDVTASKRSGSSPESGDEGYGWGHSDQAVEEAISC